MPYLLSYFLSYEYDYLYLNINNQELVIDTLYLCSIRI